MTPPRLLKIITAELGPIDSADPMDARLVSECGADSIHLIILAMEIEDTFGIDLPDDDFAALGDDPTIRAVLALVESKMEIVL
jgi:acyl carrier protein